MKKRKPETRDSITGSVLYYQGDEVVIRFYLDEGNFERIADAKQFKYKGLKAGNWFRYVVIKYGTRLRIQIKRYKISKKKMEESNKMWDELKKELEEYVVCE